MRNFFYRQAISLVLGLIDDAIKSPKARAKWRNLLLELAERIDDLFPERRM